MVVYPVTFPSEAIKVVIDTISSGDWASKKDEFAHAAWNLQGYLQSILLPLSTQAADYEPLSLPTSVSTVDDYEVMESFKILSSVKEGGDFTAQSLPALPVPVALLLKWLLQKLIEELIK